MPPFIGAEEVIMVYTVISLIVLAVELVFIGIYVSDAFKKRKFIDGDNILYFVPLTFILFVLYVVGAIYNASAENIQLTILDFTGMAKAALAATVFDVDGAYTALLIQDNICFLMAFILALILSVACVYTSVISLVFNYFANAFKVGAAIKSGCDVLIGENEYNEIYIKNSKNTVLIITDTEKPEKKDSYYANGIPFIAEKFDGDRIARYFERYIARGKRYNFICFNSGESNLHHVKNFEDFAFHAIKTKKHKGESFVSLNGTSLKIELDYENQSSLQDAILSNKKIAPYISCFSRHELIGTSFVYEHPVTRCLPEDFIDTELAVIKENKVINTVYIGFGRTSDAVYKAQLMNDCLPTLKNGEPSIFNINYYAFDKEAEADKTKNTNFIVNRYDDRYKSYNKNEYFDLINPINNIRFEQCNINSPSFMEKCIKTLSRRREERDGQVIFTAPYEKNEVFNRLFITYGNDTDNIDLALKLASLLRELGLPNYEIFIKTKSGVPEALNIINDSNIKSMISLGDIFNHDTLINDRVLMIARLVNTEYGNLKKGVNVERWYRLPCIKQLSNVYSALNLRLKLNLLGYDFEICPCKVENNDLLNELKEKVAHSEARYEDFLIEKGKALTAVKMIAYQEHLRWNAFYVVNGYVPLKKGMIRAENNDGKWFLCKDDNLSKQHACVTSNKGLDEYHRLCAEMLTDKNGLTYEENLWECNTYRYDYMLMDEAVKRVFIDSEFKLLKR